MRVPTPTARDLDLPTVRDATPGTRNQFMDDFPLRSDPSSRLAVLLRTLLAHNPFYRRKLPGLRPEDIDAPREPRDLLRRLPFTLKREIQEDQAEHPPHGSNLTFPPGTYVRYHQTSGTSGRPIAWLDTRESWDWVVSCWLAIYRRVGIRPADRFFFPFSFGPFLGFWSAFEGACRLGNLCIPGGGLTTLARLRVLTERGITVVAATPTYALRMAEVARAEGIDLAATPVRALIVAGEPGGSVPAVKGRIESEWNARCFDHCGMTEVGPYGYECIESPGGLHVLEDEYLVEVIDPRTGEPAEAEGELVLTNLGRVGSPVLRYRTGDLVRWSRKPCPCGSPHGRLEGGILGRADDMVIVRGNNVFPSAVDAILRRIPEIAEYRVRVRTRDAMTSLLLEVEPITGGSPTPDSREPLRGRVAEAIEAALLFEPEVSVVDPGSLPRFELKARRWIKE
jgi:phenylacetate-CoA ligase